MANEIIFDPSIIGKNFKGIQYFIKEQTDRIKNDEIRERMLGRIRFGGALTDGLDFYPRFKRELKKVLGENNFHIFYNSDIINHNVGASYNGALDYIKRNNSKVNWVTEADVEKYGEKAFDM